MLPVLDDPEPLETLDIASVRPAPQLHGPYQLLPLDTSLSELDLFALLLWRFGRPNGVFSVLGPPQGDPDGPFKWDFSFRCPGGTVLAIVRTWLGIEVRGTMRPVHAETVNAFLRHNICVHKDDVIATREMLERHVLVINPYVRHRRMAQHAERTLREISVPPLHYPIGLITAQDEIERHVAATRAHIDAAHRAMFYSVSLVTESAFAAEAFINLIIGLSMPPPMRANRQLQSETLRRDWRSKILHLPLTTTIVRSVPDLNDARIQRAANMFTLRNRIVHSYPHPDALSVGHVHFFQCYPVLEDGEPFNAFQLGTQRLLPTRDEALAATAAAGGLIEFITGLIEPSIRDTVLMACNASPLGWRADLGTFSVPFGPHPAWALFPDGPRASEDGASEEAPSPDGAGASSTEVDRGESGEPS